MTNLCDVCGKPATQSMLRDLFGKSDEMRFVCSDHGFRIRDPADVAEVKQLRDQLRVACIQRDNAADEIERLRATLKRAADTLDRCRYSEQPMAKECYAVLAGTHAHEPKVSRCTCIPAVTHDDYCATKSEHASRDASPADLVGALQDVVHTDPGPVRAGKAHQSASWECECEAPNNFQHESLEWCPDCGKNRPRMRTGE